MSEHDETPQPVDRPDATPSQQPDLSTPQHDQQAGAFGESTAPRETGAEVLYPKRRVGKTTMLATVVAVVLAVGAVTFVLRSSTAGGPALDALVPATAVGYVEVQIEPSTEQRQALRRLLDRFGTGGESVTSKFVDALDEGLKDFGLTFEQDVKPWLGARASIAALVPERGDKPTAVAVVAVRDAAAATSALSQAQARAREEKDFAYVVDGNIAYIAKTEAEISSFRSAAENASLADDASYSRLRADTGDSLGVAYVDGNAAEKLIGSGARGVIPGGAFPGLGAGGSGKSIAALRAEDSAAVVVGASEIPERFPLGATGVPAVLEDGPASLQAAMTMFDVAKTLENFLKQAGDSASQEAEEGLRQFGLRLERDIYPWLHGEMSIVFGGFSGAPSPDLGAVDAGIVIQSTDDEAAERTLDALARALEASGMEVSSLRDGFSVEIDQGTVVVRRARGRVVAATNNGYADQLLDHSGNRLGDDAVYRRSFEGTGDDVTFQLYVRIDKLRQFAELFLPRDTRQQYDEDVAPIVRPMEALAIRVWKEGDLAKSRMAITLTPQQ